ncbi:ABC transporter permease [Embleya sp. AB8]|uniref:ABC transporter permease n=1 Tax=Embleya sp. AB8 TaxID=3156304 RepID=UPI003C793642
MSALARPPGWVGWLARRLAGAVAAILTLSAIVFAATQALPSDPARTVLGPDATEASIAELRRQLGLDRPLFEQYLSWLGDLLGGDPGTSVDSRLPVGKLLGERLANSLALLTCVLVTALAATLLFGILAAVHRDRRLDRVITSVAVTVQAVPAFVLAIALVMVFATSVFHVLPAASLIEPGHSPWARPEYLVLPTIALALSVTPYLLRQLRGALIEALDADHVVAARLRGVPEHRLLLRHALPGALVPLVQGVALTLSVLFGGSLVVEAAFTYPGIGSALDAAVGVRDLPVVQACVLLIATGVVTVNLLADLLTVLLTPRLRTASGFGGRVAAAEPEPAPVVHPSEVAA